MTSTASAQSPLAVTVSGLCKRFPGVTALDDVSLDFATGRITAVLGENGAGKSTLMSILAGLQKPDEGVVHVGGRPVDRFSATALLHDHGVALVPQEIALAAERSVAENILMGQEPGVLPSRRRMVGRATSLLDEVGSTIDPRQRAGALSTADQQLLLIVRAIARDCRVLILDEPTTSLTGQEVASLFTLLRRLRDAGTAVIYVSHRLPEIFEICEDIHVLRDGRHVASFGTAQVTPQQLVAAMVGREVAERPYDRRAEGRSVLSLRGLTSAAFADVDLDVRAGEVVGVAGLPDSGRSELLAAIFGAVPSRGSIHLDGEKVTLRSPRDAIKCGIGYVPAERRAQAIFPDMSVGRNAVVLDVEDLSWFGMVPPRRLRALADERIRANDVRGSIAGSITGLSGGNQQKVIIGRWLARKPKLLLLDDPTRGVDVGAKEEIHDRIDGAARQGAAVLMSSSDLPELLRTCDRIVVLSQGRVAGTELAIDATEESIMRLATRDVAPSASRPEGK